MRCVNPKRRRLATFGLLAFSPLLALADPAPQPPPRAQILVTREGVFFMGQKANSTTELVALMAPSHPQTVDIVIERDAAFESMGIAIYGATRAGAEVVLTQK